MAAYMEDADEDGHALTGTRVAASVATSPIKEKANSKKSRRSGSISPIVYGQTDSDSTILSPRKREKEPKPRSREKDRVDWDRDYEREREREREPRRPSTKKNPGPRPPAKTSKTSPILHTNPRKPKESEYYGVQSTGSSGQRFRSGSGTPHSGGVPITGGSAARSMSYHGKPHPPPSNYGFYSTSPYASSFTSYPPPYGSPYGSSYGGPPSSNPMAHHHSGMPPASPVDSYLDGPGHDHLKQRFQSTSRPASAIGFRNARRTSYFDDREEEPHPPAVSRKASVKGKKERDMQDRVAMPPPPPPPPRPKSTRPGMLRPPPPQTHRTRGYDEESFDGDESMYRDIPPRRSVEFSSSQPRSRRMSIAHGGAALQLREPSVGPARPRPNSYYDVDDSDYEYGFDDKMHDQLANAGAYQQTVSGGLTQALTKDALQKATRRSQGGSSRSTRSSSSHDESEWRNSATTRTTRSVGNDDDFTIKVTGQAVVEVSGTKIECLDGSAISISSRPPPPQPRLSDSDKGSIAYDERKPRLERLPFRHRALSQSGSFTRTRDGYEMYPRDADDWRI